MTICLFQLHHPRVLSDVGDTNNDIGHFINYIICLNFYFSDQSSQAILIFLIAAALFQSIVSGCIMSGKFLVVIPKFISESLISELLTFRNFKCRLINVFVRILRFNHRVTQRFLQRTAAVSLRFSTGF